MRSYILLIVLAVLATAECWYTCTRTGYGISYCTAEDCIATDGPDVQPGSRLYIAPYAIVEVCQCYNAGVFKRTATAITCRMVDNTTTVYTTHYTRGADGFIIFIIVVIALACCVFGLLCVRARFIDCVRYITSSNRAFAPVDDEGGDGMGRADATDDAASDASAK